jgi:hypothetical protein
LLFLASLAWLIGYAGAYAACRHRNAWLHIFAVGAALVVTVSYAENVGGYFFVFAPAAILLFVQLHASRRERGWRRAGIELPKSFRAGFLRQGLLSALAIVLLSTWAPSVASGQEFVSLWQTVDRPWNDMQAEFSRLFGPINTGNAVGASNYGPTLALQSAVALSDQPVFEIRVRAIRPGLLGLEAVFQHRLRHGLCFLLGRAEFDPTELVRITHELARAATTGVDLGLDDNAAATGELIEGPRRFIGRLHNDVPRSIRARGGEELLGLILVNLHYASSDVNSVGLL